MNTFAKELAYNLASETATYKYRRNKALTESNEDSQLDWSDDAYSCKNKLDAIWEILKKSKNPKFLVKVCKEMANEYAVLSGENDTLFAKIHKLEQKLSDVQDLVDHLEGDDDDDTDDEDDDDTSGNKEAE